MSGGDAAAKAANGELWDEFCDALKAAGRLVLRPDAPSDAVNRALGYRCLAQLVRAGLESALDYADPYFPAFFRMADETKKMLNDNPDNHYLNCVVDGRCDYRIRGRHGSVDWFSLGSKGSAVEVTGMEATGNIDSSTLRFEPDGSFEILASATPKPANWLPLQPHSRMILVRQTFADRKSERGYDFTIECLNPPTPDNNLTPEKLEAGLAGAVRLVRDIATLTLDWQDIYRQNHLNLLPADDQARCQAAGGDPNIFYYQSYWKLAPDEALLITLDDIPDCQTWNFQLSNSWMQSLDYRFFKVALNKFTAKPEADGTVRIVVAHEDPGPLYPNWITTLGLGEGGMLGRYVGATNPPAEMKTAVVKLAALRG